MSTIAATIDSYRTHVGLSPTLQRPTLVLSRNWQPINVATVARALIMLWNDSAKIVDPVDYQLYDWSDWSRLAPDRNEPFIQSVRQRIRIPEVIALTKFDAMPTQSVTFSRRNVFKRDKMCCQYCGKQPGTEELTLSHPRIDVVLVRVDYRSKGNRSSQYRFDRGLLHICKHLNHYLARPLNHSENWRLLFLQGASSSIPF